MELAFITLRFDTPEEQKFVEEHIAFLEVWEHETWPEDSGYQSWTEFDISGLEPYDIQKALDEVMDMWQDHLAGKKVIYEVWAFGYDSNNAAIEINLLLNDKDEYTDIDDARKCFDTYQDKDKFMECFGSQVGDATHVNIVLEKCLDTNGYVECIDVITEAMIF